MIKEACRFWCGDDVMMMMMMMRKAQARQADFSDPALAASSFFPTMYGPN
jgi:hypothetical protein